MSRTRRSSRKSRVRKSSGLATRYVAGVSVLLVGVAVLAAGFFYPAASLSPPEAEPTPKAVVVTPRPTATPTPTTTPTPAPTPEPEPAPWSFQGVHLTVPAAGVDGEVTPYGHGDLTSEGDVDPPGKWAISWYSGFYEEGVLSIPSAQANDTVYFFCHTYQNEPAACNNMPSLQPGAEAIVTNGNAGEQLTYVMQSSFPIDRDAFKSDDRVYNSEPAPGRLVIVTCDGDGPRDGNGRTINRIVTVFQLVEPAEVQPTPSARELEESASRLY